MRNKKRINLIPNSYLKSKRPGPDLGILVIMGFSVIIFISLGLMQYSQQKNLNKNFKSLTVAEKQLEKEISKIDYDLEDNKLMSARRDLVRGIIGTQIKWSEAFKEVSHIIPKDTWLVGLKAINNNGKMKVLLKGEAASQYQMASFFRSLERSFYFANVTMSYSELLDEFDPSVYKFQFNTPDIRTPASTKAKGGKK